MRSDILKKQPGSSTTRTSADRADREFVERLSAERSGGIGGDGSGVPPSPPHENPDWLLGALAISRWISLHYFTCNRRKVFYLFERYGSRPGGCGFFKLSGTLCLSKSAFAAWAKAKTGGARS